MSQPNGGYPPFNINIHAPTQQHAYNPYVQQTNNNFQQRCRPSRPRSVQLNMSSPSTSVRSARTAPVQRPNDRSGFYPGNRVPTGNRNSTRLPAVDTIALPTHSSRSTWDTLDRNDYQKDSWNPFNLRSSNTSEDRASLNQSNGGLKDYPTGPGSLSSVALPSDSGFYSMSVMSHDASPMDHTGVPHNITQQIGNMNVQFATSEASRLRRPHSDQRSQSSQISSRSGIDTELLKCRECNKVSKCKSDYKYVSSDAGYKGLLI
jgi:hypothetical protein